MAVQWDDRIDEILNGDAAAAVAYLTPAKGVVITPMSPIGLRDRERGTLTVTTSLGLWKKVVRLRADPAMAVAFHAREHGYSASSDFVLVQGRATVPDRPDRAWLESIQPQWERFLGPQETGWRAKLMDVYYWERIGIEMQIERILRWDNLACAGEPEVIGAPLPAEPPAPQKQPGNGTAPRVDSGKALAYGQRLPHALLGWRDADGLPMLVAARRERRRPGGRRARGRGGQRAARGPPGGVHRARLLGTDGRPGAADLHGLDDLRGRQPRHLLAAHAERQQGARIPARLRSRRRHRHPRRLPQGAEVRRRRLLSGWR